MDEEQKDVTKAPEEVKERLFDFDKVKETKGGERTESEQVQGLVVINYGTGEYIIEFNGIPFGKIDEQGGFTYFNLENTKKAFKDAGLDMKEIDLPELQQAIDLEEKAKKEQEEIQEEQEEAQEGQDEEQPEQEDNEDEIVDEEKDDEKPDLEEDKDPKKEEIAKKYNLNARNIVHMANDERVTENERFKGLVEWSKGYDDVYAVPGDDEYSYKFIGSKKGNIEEIQTGTNKVIGGKNPDVTIKRIDGEKITEIKPIAMYEVDSQTAIAIVKDEHGQPETIYCRQQEGNEKEYWGSVIPEASGKNVEQESPEVRSFMDHRNTSALDLSKKSDALTRQEDLEKRGMPSKEEGTQVEEIDGSSAQNRAVNLEYIAEDLMRRDGIKDRATVPPGFYEHKAEKVLALMEGNKAITYEQAVEQVADQSQREEGGRTPGGKNNRRG